MKAILAIFFAVSCCASAATAADITLKCAVDTRCDGYLKNCVTDAYALTVNIDPVKKRVIVGNSEIVADFSNKAEVVFTYLNFRVSINKYEYSAILSTPNEVRHGRCSKIPPAW